MTNKLVRIHKKELRVSSVLVAQGFERRHEHVTRLIKRYQERFERIKPLVVVKRKKRRGRPFDEYLLTESQFLFLGTVFQNTEIVLDFKEKLVLEFERVRNQLIAVKFQQKDQAWIASRDLGKKQRRALTDTLKNFVDYAKEQGSKNADRYYVIVSRMVYSPLFIFDGKYQSARDMLSDEQLTALANAEHIMNKGLRDGMAAKMFYRDIYQDIKSKVMTFAELHGQSKVIEEQLKLEE